MRQLSALSMTIPVSVFCRALAWSSVKEPGRVQVRVTVRVSAGVGVGVGVGVRVGFRLGVEVGIGVRVRAGRTKLPALEDDRRLLREARVELGGDVVDESAEGAAAHHGGEDGVLGALDVHLDDDVPLVHTGGRGLPLLLDGLALGQQLDEAREVDRVHVEGGVRVMDVGLSKAPADAGTATLGAQLNPRNRTRQ